MAQDNAYLEGITGEFIGREFNLIEGETTLGRGKENIIQVLDRKASRRHALIRFEEGRFIIEDLGSSGGTRVNGELVSTATLQNNDTITIGETTFVVHNVLDIESTATILDDQGDVVTVISGEEAIATRVAADEGDIPTKHANADFDDPSSPPPPGPPQPIIGDAGVVTSDGTLEKLPMKWIGVGCGIMLVMIVCIIIAILAVFLGLDTEDLLTSAQPTEVVQALPQETIETQSVLPEDRAPTSTGEVELSVSSDEATSTGDVSEISPTSNGNHSELAYASDRMGAPQVFLLNIETGYERQLTNMMGGACQPSFSSDGRRMVVTSPCSGNKVEYPGSSLYLISFDASNQPSEPEALPTSLGGGDFDPDFARHEDLLAFVSLRTSRPQVFTMDLGGGAPVNLNDDLAYNWEPSWSPDGSQVAFVTSRGGTREVWLMPADGFSESTFTRGSDTELAHPDWSPDGSLILFEKTIGTIPRLVGAPVAESGLREILVCQEGELAVQPMAEPAWSPDGAWIAFETWPDGEDHNIAIMTAACNEYRELTNKPAFDFDAAWRP